MKKRYYITINEFEFEDLMNIPDCRMTIHKKDCDIIISFEQLEVKE